MEITDLDFFLADFDLALYVGDEVVYKDRKHNAMYFAEFLKAPEIDEKCFFGAKADCYAIGALFFKPPDPHQTGD